MQKRKLASNLEVSAIGLGCMSPWIVPLPDTTKLQRLEENIRSANIELTRDDLREIESAASGISVQGARYPENVERLSYR